MSDDIVQRIGLEGGTQFVNDLQQIAAQGSKAFAALDAAVAQFSGNLDKASSTAAGAGSKIGAGLSEAGSKFADLGGKVIDLGKSLVGATKGFAGFSGGMKTLGIVIAGGAGLRVVSLIRNIGRLVSAANDGGKSVDDMTAEVKASSEAFLANTERAASNAQAWTDLAQSQRQASEELRQNQSDSAALTEETRRLEDITQQRLDSIRESSGLSRQEAAAQSKQAQRAQQDALRSFQNSQQQSQLLRKQAQERQELARRQAEEEEKTRQLALAHSAEAESLKRATDAAEKKAAVDKLSALFGPQIAGALLQTSQAFIQVRQQFLNAFGADIAAAILKIGDFLRDNAKTAFQFAESFRSAFKDIIIPAAKALLQGLDVVAQALNSVFDTKLTGGSLLAALAILKVTGAFGALVGIVRGVIGVVGALFALFGRSPLGILIGLILLLGIYLATKVDWKNFGENARRVILILPNFFRDAFQKIKDIWNGITTFFGDLWQGIKDTAGGVWDSITGAASDAVQGVVDAWNAVIDFFGGMWDSITQTFSDAWEGIKSFASDAVEGVKNAWNAIGEFFNGLWEGIKTIFSDAWTAIKEFFQPTIDFVMQAWDGIKQFFADVWESVKNTFSNAIDSIVGFFQPAIDKAKAFIDVLRSVAEAIGLVKKESADAANSEGAPGLRGGGPVRGPGTETSDSIIARLSRGEFVMRAAAVKKYGVSFMHSVNRMAANVRGYAQGGLADFLSQPIRHHGLPAYAGGGSVDNAGSTKVVLNIGGESFDLETREKSTIKALQRFVTAKRLTSGGRKASRVGG